ncbi:MAG: peptidylprolyl isomerase [Cytophagales bacterium]|nr:peptidylprolyl isomerase [Cytophagales bacterium]
MRKNFRRYSNTKDNGGLLKPFGIGALASVPEFEAMAFAMQEPGEISDPFQSSLDGILSGSKKKFPYLRIAKWRLL